MFLKIKECLTFYLDKLIEQIVSFHLVYHLSKSQ